MKKLLYWFYNKIGYAYDMYIIHEGGETITLRSDGLVIVSDGISSDAVPITMCSEQLIERFTKMYEEAK